MPVQSYQVVSNGVFTSRWRKHYRKHDINGLEVVKLASTSFPCISQSSFDGFAGLKIFFVFY